MTSEEARALIREFGWREWWGNDQKGVAVAKLVANEGLLHSNEPHAERSNINGWFVGFGRAPRQDRLFFYHNRLWFPTEEEARACVATIKLLRSVS